MADPGGKIAKSQSKYPGTPEGQSPLGGGKMSYGKKSMKKNPGSHKGGKYGY